MIESFTSFETKLALLKSANDIFYDTFSNKAIWLSLSWVNCPFVILVMLVIAAERSLKLVAPTKCLKK
jgi:hypothetical protein